MLSVVIWHLMNNLNDCNNINRTFVYRFLDIVQLPLFMLVSGYFCYYARGSRITTIIKRFRQLIFPVIFMGIFYILYISFKYPDSEFLNLLKIYYTGTNPYYFLICLFELYCIYSLTSFIKTSNIYVQTSLYIFIYGCLCLIIYSIPTEISRGLFLSEIILRFYWPFILGIYLNQFSLSKILFKSNAQIIYLIINTSLFYCLYISDNTLFPPGIGFIISQLFTLCLISHIAAIAHCLILTNRGGKIINFFVTIGTNSLAIYLLHYFFRFDLSGLIPLISTTQFSSCAILLILLPLASSIITLCLCFKKIINTNNTLSLLLLGNTHATNNH